MTTAKLTGTPPRGAPGRAPVPASRPGGPEALQGVARIVHHRLIENPLGGGAGVGHTVQRHPTGHSEASFAGAIM